MPEDVKQGLIYFACIVVYGLFFGYTARKFFRPLYAGLVVSALSSVIMVAFSIWEGTSITNYQFWLDIFQLSVLIFGLVYYEIFIIIFSFLFGFLIKSNSNNDSKNSSSGKGGSFGGGGSSSDWK
jgi:uncharacterized membrane protein YgcG